MKVCVGGLPKVDGCVYITNRLQQTSARLDVPLGFYHLLPLALVRDSLVPPRDVEELLEAELAVRELSGSYRLDLGVLEVALPRHEALVRLLRSYFPPKGPEGGRAVAGFAPGLAHTSLLSALAYEADAVVVDIRGVQLDGSFATAILAALEARASVFLSCDDLPPWLALSHVDEVYAAPSARASALSRLARVSEEALRLDASKKLVLGRRPRVEQHALEWHDDKPSTPRRFPVPPIDYLATLFPDEKVRSVVEAYLLQIEEQGGWDEKSLLTDLVSSFANDKALALAVLRKLVRFGLLVAHPTAAGRYFILSERGGRVAEEVRERV